MTKMICHEHCPRGSHGGGKAAAVVLVVVAAGVYSAAKAAAPSIEHTADVVLHLLEIAALILASGTGLAGVGWLVHRQRQGAEVEAEEHARVSTVTALPQRRSAALSAPREPLAIEAPREQAEELTGMTDAVPAWLAEAIQRAEARRH
jgi:hypothetical protein